MFVFVPNMLDEAPEEKKAELSQAYIDAAQDTSRNEVFEEWSALEGLDSQEWEW